MSETSPSPKRDINAVLAKYSDRLLAIPAVVGVYVSVLGDRRTPCLRIMLSERKSPSEQPIPQTLDGFPSFGKLLANSDRSAIDQGKRTEGFSDLTAAQCMCKHRVRVRQTRTAEYEKMFEKLKILR